MAGTTTLVRRPGPPSPPPRRRRPWPLWSRILIWVAVLVAMGLAASVLAGQSSVRSASLHTADEAPPVVPVTPPPPELTAQWSADADGPAPPTVVEGAVLLTSEHGVASHDLMSGDERWHYTRADATLCAAHPGATVVAIFRTDERCDEAIGLDPGTGQRVWYRNLNLSPEAEVRGNSDLALAVTSSGLLGIETFGGSTRFRYRPSATCTIDDANSGQVGVVLIQTCEPLDQPATTSLVGLSSVNGEQEWTVPLASPNAALLATDAVTAVGITTEPPAAPAIQVYGRGGLSIATLSDPALPAVHPPQQPGVPPTVALAVAHALIWNGQQIAAVGLDTGTLVWNSLSSVAPTVTGQEVAVLQGPNQLIRLNLLDGTEVGRSVVDTELAGATLTRVGAAVVAVTDHTVTVLG